MSDTGGRPREYGSHAERQAAYRARKAQQAADTQQALVRLRQALRAAARSGRPVKLDAGAVDTDSADAAMLDALTHQVEGRAPAPAARARAKVAGADVDAEGLAISERFMAEVRRA